MFNKDTKMLTEAYGTVVNEGKMKELHMAIEQGLSVEEICQEMGIECTPEIEKFIGGLRDEYFEKGEREEDAERCPVTGKLRKKSDEESSDEEEEQEIAMSPQAINRAMIERGRNELHRHHQIERMFRHGY